MFKLGDIQASKIGSVYMIVFSIALIFIIIFYFSLFDIDISQYTRYLLDSNSDLYNKPLMELLMGNTLVNLPNIIINTNDEYINSLQECENKAIYMGVDDGTNYLDICKNKCGGVGELYTIYDTDEFYQDGEKLIPGVYCILNPPDCNLKTSYVIATVNSRVCRSKFPNLFGGEAGSIITACNDEKYPATGSVLWDYANNEAVNVNTINMTHEDETLEDGSFRFRCKYTETANGNPFIENPISRFHPIDDVCNRTIYRASYDVHAVVNPTDWYCECGDFSTTRVKHLNESDPKSTCTSCYAEVSVTNEKLGYKEAKIPYLCFNQASSWQDGIKQQPCLDLPEHGNTCGIYTQEFVQRTKELGAETQYLEYGAQSRDFLPMEIDPEFSRRLLGHKRLNTR